MRAGLIAPLCIGALWSPVIAAPARPCETDHCESQKKIFDWVESNGGLIHPSVELSTGNDPSWNVRGVFATADIGPNEIIFQLPKELLMCATTESSEGARQCALIDILAAETNKGPESFYEPYVHNMGDHDVDLPAIWAPTERDLLKGLYPKDWTRHLTWFEEVCNGDIKDAAKVRAMLLVVSRSNAIDEYPCLCPLYDAFNHGNFGTVNIDTFIRDDKLTSVTLEPLTAGQQLFSNFGEENVGRLFRDYGFISQHPRLWQLQSADGTVHDFWEDKESDGEIIISMGEEVLMYPVHAMTSIYEDFKEQLEYITANEPIGFKELSNSVSPPRLATALEFRNGYIRALRGAAEALKNHITEQVKHFDL